MAYRVVVKCGGGAFFVPNEAAENLKLCSAGQLRVLLLTLSQGMREMTPETAAAELSLTVEDARDLLDYWVNRGILECDGRTVTAAKTPVIETPKPKPVPVGEPPLAATKPLEVKPTMKEVERLQKEDTEVAFVLSEAERILGVSFTCSDTATLVWLVRWAGVPAEVLITVVEYCSSGGKKSMRYIQKVALEWLDAGIDTLEKAEERMSVLNEARSWEGEVKNRLEIHGRSLVTKEKEFCETWRKMELAPELIRAAYERTIEQTGKLSFPYINKILISWKQKGISTPEEAAKETKAATAGEDLSFDPKEIELRAIMTTPSL